MAAERDDAERVDGEDHAGRVASLRDDHARQRRDLTATVAALGLLPGDGVETLKAKLAGHGLAVNAIVPDALTTYAHAVVERLVVEEGSGFPGIGETAAEAIRHAAVRAFLASCPDSHA